jgi:2-C-methyl-D-erythritol 2,4-cyclodiphosphate synthase
VTGFRVGTGFDAHRLVRGRPLVLGGVSLTHARGLEGHSDGDCLTHAVCDAILGAAAAGDLGRYFPSSDARWKDASSLRFLEAVERLVERMRWTVENVDATVVAEAPALAPYLDQMRAVLAATLGIGIERVSVKAKTSDGLGPIGRGEGVAAYATALLRHGVASRRTRATPRKPRTAKRRKPSARGRRPSTKIARRRRAA